MKLLHRFFSATIVLVLALSQLAIPSAGVQARTNAIATFTGNTYSQDFNTLPGTGSPVPAPWANDTNLPGWYLVIDSTPNVTSLLVDWGTQTTNGFYSYGATGANDRTLGSLGSNSWGTSGTAKAYMGVALQNTTGSAIASLDLAYMGEQWRNSANTSAQSLTFDYKTSASAPVDATAFNKDSTGWTSVPALTFTTPTVGGTAGALIGNADANRRSLSATISGLNIPANEYVLLRWADTNDANNDHGLGIDDLTVAATPAINSLSINDVSVTEGDSGTSTAAFTVSLSSPAPVGGVSFDIQTIDGSATTADSDYVSNSLTSQTIAEGNLTYTFNVTVNGDTNIEPDETFTAKLTNVTGVNLGDDTGLGTITNDDAVVPSLSINDVSLLEGNAGTSTAVFTVSLSSPALAGGVTFDIATADNTATVANSDYVDNSLTGQTITEGNDSYTFNVTVNGDVANEPDETFFVNVSNVTGATVADGQGQGTIRNDEFTPIYTLQGSGDATTLTGVVTTQGIVVGDYEGASPALRGFFIQDATGDANPLTSDGIFVYNLSADSVSLGDLVSVTGTIGENQGQTQLSLVSNITVLGSGNTLTPTDVTLPFASATEAEKYEGMLVRVPQPLYVTEIYQLGRFGEVMLASERLAQPTNITTPGAAALAVQAANNLKSIMLDDDSQAQNPDPIKFGRGGLPLSASNTLRGGDSITNLTGVMTYTWGGQSASPNAYRIRPINALGVSSMPNFVAGNPRPTGSPALAAGSTLRVAGMNLLNYFTDFGNGACTGGITGATMDCRGATNLAEFNRQAPKTVAAIIGTNADAIGIAEMENDGYAADSAIYDLVSRLNAVAGAGTYAYVHADSATGGIDVLGSDAIKVGFIYKPARVSVVGVAALNTVAFVNGGDGAARNRPALAATFQQADGARVTLVINHLKSKGSACDAPDAGDGQGNCNQVRVNAATELANWLATDPTGSNDPDFLILGDLNSYAREDPITTLQTAGYTNLISALNGPLAYSYVFDGQWGYLDHALGSSSVYGQTTAVADWHINSDEPIVLDYNTEFKTAGQLTSLYANDEFRMGDHDPVLVDLNLKVPTVTISQAAAQADPTSSLPVNFTATFNYAIDPASFTAADITQSGSATGVTWSVTNSGNDKTFTIAATSVAASGTLIPTIAANKVKDSLGNYNLASTAGTDSSVTFDLIASANADLSALSLSSGTLTPVFSSGTLAYTSTVPNSVNSLTVTPTLANLTSSVKVNGSLVVSGSASGPVSLNVGVNIITVVVTAQDGITTKSYTVTVTRQAPDVTLSGNVGIAGATISYTGGSTTADAVTGAYSITVANGWTGTITPAKTGYVFTPASINFQTSVTSNQTGQDFSAAAHASFQDVPTSYWAWLPVEVLYANGITKGCANSPLRYCPEASVTRAEMAVFLLRAKYGSTYAPPAATGVFQDVPQSYWAAAWIEKLAAEGITNGCGVTPLRYCPDSPVSRDQMAVFLLRVIYGSDYVPPAPIGIFADVPLTYWNIAWIEQLAAEGITSGCSINPLRYCPANPVTRSQMAVFLGRTFNLR